MKETELIYRMKRGQGFELFLEKYGGIVLSVVRRMVFNRQAHEDLAQDVFVKIAVNIADFRGDAKLSTWVYTIAYRHCLDHINRERRDIINGATDITERDDIGHWPPDMEERTDLERGLMKLEEKYRIFVAMKYIDGLSLHEIAEVTGLGIGAVKTRIHRGIVMLREIMENMAGA